MTLLRLRDSNDTPRDAHCDERQHSESETRPHWHRHRALGEALRAQINAYQAKERQIQAIEEQPLPGTVPAIVSSGMSA